MHKAILSSSDIEERPGFRTTTPLRTLLDVARAGISQEQLVKAATEALERGIVRRGKLLAAIQEDPALSRLGLIVNPEESRKS